VAPVPLGDVAAAQTAEAGATRIWRADRGDVRHRLDHALLRHLAGLPGLSRSRVQSWVAAGLVRVNGAPATRPAGRLAAGDEVEVQLPPPPPAPPPLAADELPLSILYEDEHLLAVDKPAGLVVHPTARRRRGTLLNALLWHLRPALCEPPSAAPAGARPGLVNRLDRDTSGVVLVAKSRAAHAGLARAMKQRSMEKDYLAVVYGRAPLRKGRIDLDLLRDPHDRRRITPLPAAASAGAPPPQGRNAVTLYEVLAEVQHPAGAWLSLLRCRLVTGRTHQIRVHLAAVGLPIVGDPLYGEPRHRGIADPALAAACRDFPRQALHARRLALRHPLTRQQLELQAPIPADLRRLLHAAGLNGEPEADRRPA
jgi:23S rRNA pseudouridine1911/1915/1917 synthase